jgi:hypothetical protein
MIVSCAIISKAGKIFYADFLPQEVKLDISKNANTFLYTLNIEDDDIELPYIETTYLRYVYKQTDDLYWLLVTKPESNLVSDVNLLGKFVCTIMEYGQSDTNSDTLTDEQKELFYRHLWRPWDEAPQCPTCGRYNNQAALWEGEFDCRLQFLIQIRDGHMDPNDVRYFNGLISESWAINASLTSKADRHGYDSESDSVCSSETRSISEETVIESCRLACRLEDIRIEIKRIQDPYLRLFARRDLLTGSAFNQQSQLSSAPSFEELDSTCQ